MRKVLKGGGGGRGGGEKEMIQKIRKNREKDGKIDTYVHLHDLTPVLSPARTHELDAASKYSNFQTWVEWVGPLKFTVKV